MATKTKKNTKSRTAQTGLKKRVGIPKWAIFATVLIVAGVGVALVYNSFASAPQTIVYCYSNNNTRCADTRRGFYSVPKSAYVRSNSRCSMGGTEFKLTTASKNGAWHCLFRGV